VAKGRSTPEKWPKLKGTSPVTRKRLRCTWLKNRIRNLKPDSWKLVIPSMLSQFTVQISRISGTQLFQFSTLCTVNLSSWKFWPISWPFLFRQWNYFWVQAACDSLNRLTVASKPKRGKNREVFESWWTISQPCVWDNPLSGPLLATKNFSIASGLLLQQAHSMNLLESPLFNSLKRVACLKPLCHDFLVKTN
jgi:hypothetical protein